jgi:hypothetical protein
MSKHSSVLFNPRARSSRLRFGGGRRRRLSTVRAEAIERGEWRAEANVGAVENGGFGRRRHRPRRSPSDALAAMAKKEFAR